MKSLVTILLLFTLVFNVSASEEVELQEAKNSLLALRNAKLSGDVKDLKDGTRAIEERARVEHGLIKEGEFFVQILPPDKTSTSITDDALKQASSRQ